MKPHEKGNQESKEGQGTGKVILVVDDEEAIRNITTILLRKNGFTTLVASEGSEAVALYDQNKTVINLIILDLMMPVMDGETCIQALQELNPDVKIIGVSGLIDSDMNPETMAKLSYFLKKPFTIEEMLAAIRAVV